MVKKKRLGLPGQVASFDPFIRDAAGNPIGTTDPSPFLSGGGSAPTPAIKGTETPREIKPGVFTAEPTAFGIARPSGITLPTGRTFLGLSPSEVAQVEQQFGLSNVPLISEEARVQRERMALEKPTEEALAGLGASVSTTPTQQEIGTEARKGAAVLSISLALSLLTKGAGSTLTSRGLVAGAGVTIERGRERQKVSEYSNAFSDSKQLIGQSIDAYKNGDISFETLMVLLDQEMQNINRQERGLKIMTSDWLLSYISGGKDELENIEAFRRQFNSIVIPEVVSARQKQEIAPAGTF